MLNAAALAALAPGADNVFGSGEALVVNVDFNRPFGFRRQVTFRVLAGVFVPPGSATVGKT